MLGFPSMRNCRLSHESSTNKNLTNCGCFTSLVQITFPLLTNRIEVLLEEWQDFHFQMNWCRLNDIVPTWQKWTELKREIFQRLNKALQTWKVWIPLNTQTGRLHHLYSCLEDSAGSVTEIQRSNELRGVKLFLLIQCNPSFLLFS